MKNRTKAAIAATSCLLLFHSMHIAAEAAPANTAKEVTVLAAAKAPSAAEKKKAVESEKAKYAKMKKNPGDYYILYVSDKSLNGGDHFSNYLNMYNFKSYEDYMKVASKLKTPALKRPDGLPEGYKFTKADIEPPILAYGDKYRKEVKAEAKDKAAYLKLIKWTEAGQVDLEFKNGKDVVQLQFSLMSAEIAKKHGKQKGYHFKAADEWDEETKKKHPQFVKNILSWTDNQYQFTISTNPENPLTKEELIELAESAVQQAAGAKAK
ncbi:hypothetical protein WJ0W_006240 [Paenibacillus melissococcoides]|uniref:DUF4367 domain-containing protein n=1 Tax=Paenibacillus melissococcoides TaxID=2912268 RepID=A0ABN8UFH0_9BACL|nr:MULTISPECIES: hypothetical protein [Paenibacillus]MEB9892371.1 hypothetical protein [Bacillus cereus]GIO81828.1 hypothetical protein J6TS7_54380 [Paenibacillus dendritiformis]CAH8249053.1 hypothetical protein WJ0W_006240 [Paenibacillus melissococcoides]